jgi:hypothetical protein
MLPQGAGAPELFRHQVVWHRLIFCTASFHQDGCIPVQSEDGFMIEFVTQPA